MTAGHSTSRLTAAPLSRARSLPQGDVLETMNESLGKLRIHPGLATPDLTENRRH